MSLDFEAVTHFFNSRSKDLRRIASGSGGELELGDVQNEAWIEAQKLANKRGFPFNFLDLVDQNHLLARLYLRLVKYADKTLRFAVKLDTDWDKEESASFGATLARILAAATASDPQTNIHDRPDALDIAEAVQDSYSEASAYVVLLTRFEWDSRDLASYLRIVSDTLRVRLRKAGCKVAIQSSLFDGLEKIPPDFQPLIWTSRLNQQITHLEGNQRAWIF